MTNQKIIPCLWFDNQAEEAANFYISIFNTAKTKGFGGNKESKIMSTTKYGESGAKASGMQKGKVMTVSFQLNGQEFVALNGGPAFKFTEAISFTIICETQEELDYYWEKLSEGGDEKAQICGWLKDKYGLSWQIVPAVLQEILEKGDKKSEKVMAAVLKMKKIDINALKKA